MDFKKYGISTPQDLLNFLKKNMKYGFTYKNKIYTEDEDFTEKMNKCYRLRKGENFIKSGYGVCYDFCEFERDFFKQINIPHECYFFLSCYNEDEGGPTHTFLIYQQNKKWFWFEYAWADCCGIWEYKSKQAALADIMKKFCKYTPRPYKKVYTFKTKTAKAGLNFNNFINHCTSGEEIEL